MSKRLLKLIVVLLGSIAISALLGGVALTGQNNGYTYSVTDIKAMGNGYSGQLIDDGCYSIVPKDAPTGLILPSEEEQALINAQAEKVITVLPNAFGLERINVNRTKNNLDSLQQNYAMPNEGIITDKNASILKTVRAPLAASLLILPKAVDNSKLNYFPPIGDQGTLGTCSPFATSYYLATYTTAFARNWDVHAGDYSKIFSPKWSYNLLNNGSDDGCWPGDIAYTMERIGALTWNEFPYDKNFREWPSDAAKWKSALKYRATGYGYIYDVNTPEGFSNLKNILNNGKIVVMITDSIYGWMGNAIKDNVNSVLDDGEVGKWAAYYMNESGGRHAMALVGYNDDIWIDRNNDDIQQPNELGAYKVANSWGSNWGDNGFTWFSYASVNDTMESTGHNGILLGNCVMYLNMSSTDYVPTLTAEISLTTAHRGDLQYYYGINWSETTLPNPISRFDWNGGYFKLANLVGWPFYNHGGDYSLVGTTDARPGTILIDLSDVAKGGGTSIRHDWTQEGGLLSYCMGVLDSEGGNTAATINQISFENWKTGESVSVSDLQGPDTLEADFLWYHAVNVLNPELSPPTDDPSINSLPLMLENSSISTSSSSETDVKKWRFKPSKTGTYILKTNSQRTYFEIQNSAGDTLYNVDTIRDDITAIRATLYAEETYIIKANVLPYYSENVQFDIEIYSINPATNADISDLMIKDFDFMPVPIVPSFDKNVSDYTVIIENGKNNIRIYPIPESERSRMRINGEDKRCENVILDIGKCQTVDILISSFDGSASKEYHVTLKYPSIYKVSFDSQGGSAIVDIQVQENGLLTKPKDPTRSGYAFQGWYREAGCTHAWNFATDKVTGNITLYARWMSTIPASVKVVSASFVGVSVSWASVPGASGYEVWRSMSDKTGFIRVKTTTAAAITDTGLVTGKTYYYKVISYKGTVKSGFSAVVSAKPIPATPYSLRAARASARSIKLTWGAVSGATRYEIWRCTTSATGTFVFVGSTTARYYTNSSLTTGRTYYYKIRAYHLEGRVKVYSAFTSVVSAKP